MTTKNIDNPIYKLRKAAGLSREETCELLGISTVSLSKIENDRIGKIRLSFIRVLEIFPTFTEEQIYRYIPSYKTGEEKEKLQLAKVNRRKGSKYKIKNPHAIKAN